MNNQPGRGGPVTLIVVGALAMIMGPIIGLVMTAFSAFDSIDISNPSQYQSTMNGGTVTIQSADQWAILPENTDALSDLSLSCDVTDSGGSELSMSSNNGIPLFTTPSAGDYTIDCTGVSGSLLIVPASLIDSLMNNIGGIAGWLIGGFAVGFIGFVALIIGIVWLVGVNRKRREAASAQGPYGGYGGGQPPYGGAPYGGQAPYGSQQSPYGQQPQYGQQPPQGQSYGENPQYGESPRYGENPPSNGQQSPQYGQSPAEPPRYGERIDPYRPPEENK